MNEVDRGIFNLADFKSLDIIVTALKKKTNLPLASVLFPQFGAIASYRRLVQIQNTTTKQTNNTSRADVHTPLFY